MIISRSLNFIFIHIHKTGGSSMEIALDPYLRWDDLVLGSTPLGEAMNDHYRRRYGLHKHSSIQEVQNVCGADLVARCYCFAMVRHPVHRICSLYNFVGSIVTKWAVNKGLSVDAIRADLNRFAKAHPPLGWPASRAFIQSQSFAEFLAHPDLYRDEGFLPQTSRLSLEGKGLACTPLKLEECNHWLPKLSARLGVDLKLPHVNASGQKLVSAETISPESRETIRTMFAEDFATFGYD